MIAEASASSRRAAFRFGLAALLLCLATLAARWPGIAMYDTLSQYEQATSGDFFDWHPPIMARLWALLLPLWPGTQPFLLAQAVLWWGGLGLLAAALGQGGRHRAGVAVLAAGALPLFVGWDTVVLKDAQLASCLVAATGLVAHWRLRGDGHVLPRWAAISVGILIGYATLVRGNAMFATVPLAVALFGGRLRSSVMRIAVTAGLILAVLVAGPVINRHLLRARASGVERALPLYDVAGIAHQAGLPDLTGAAPGEWREAERRGCYTPYFWNPYGMPTQCQALGRHLAFDPESGGPIIRLWMGLIARHPVAWAEHRLRHLNSNLRFLVGPDEADAVPPVDSERNDLGLGQPASGSGRALVAAAGLMAGTPLGWPFAWLAMALVLLWAGARAQDPVARFGRALAVSAATMSASYAIVSIASDLRYHLWSMVAAALAVVLLFSARAVDPHRLKVGMGVVALLCLAGGVARMVLPPEPSPYPAAGALPGTTG